MCYGIFFQLPQMQEQTTLFQMNETVSKLHNELSKIGRKKINELSLPYLEYFFYFFQGNGSDMFLSLTLPEKLRGSLSKILSKLFPSCHIQDYTVCNGNEVKQDFDSYS